MDEQTSDRAPRVSIGLPVYNGSPYIEEAIRSVLSQSHRDLELIISDNASTDDTEQICRKYAALDPRVVYLRNEQNVGAAGNFNRVFELSSGKFFKWAAADNAIEPEFVERCLRRLEGEPQAVLAYTRCRQRNEFEDSLRTIESERYLESPHVAERFRRLFRQIIGMQDAIWGLMRSGAVRKTQLIRPFIGADDCFLVEMVLQGTFVEVPEHLLLLRLHPNGFHSIGKRREWWKGAEAGRLHWWEAGAGRIGNRRQARWFAPSNTGRIYLPHWRRLREFAVLVLHSGAAAGEKARMLAFLTRLARTRRRLLAAEIVHVGGFLLESLGLSGNDRSQES